MAQKIPRPKRRAAPAAPAPTPAEELDILHPDREVKAGDRRLVVREYRHLEWLRMLPAVAPVVEAIAAMLEAGREPTYEEALAAIAAHSEALLPLVAQAADITAEDLAIMPPDVGELVLMTWWGVNGRFFIGRALNKVAVARQEMRLRSAGATSTPPSSPTDTSTPNSPATPAAS
jgi:uncharacterized protein DUF6631